MKLLIRTLVKTSTGVEFRRNRVYIKPNQSNPKNSAVYKDEPKPEGFSCEKLMSNTNKEAPSLPLTPTRSKPTDDTGDKPTNSPINSSPPKNLSTLKIDPPKRLTKFPTRFKDYVS